jgi:pyruvate dehydrogenase E2 component (dihydrolipoamide acetyltransferase)
MDVKLPKLGEGADSGVVVTLLVKEGDEVSDGQPMLEIENEKAVAPIPAPASGVVSRIRVKVGDRISVGQSLMSIDLSAGSPEAGEAKAPSIADKRESGKPVAAQVVETAEDDDEMTPDEGSTQTGTEVAASPTIRRMAAELGIDLTRVHGSERGGRIVMADLRAYIQRLQKRASRSAASSVAAPEQRPVAAEPVDFSKWGPISRKPLSQLRQVISRRMTENWATIPHVTQFDEADATVLSELRKKYAAAYEAKGARLTLTSFLLKIVTATLEKHPVFNSSLDESSQEIVFKEYCHIGVAVDTEAGLLVPVIRDANRKDLVQLSKELGELAAKARDRKVSLEELKGGTFTISNQGGIGGGHFTPIINKPEVAILGLGRGSLKPVTREGRVESRTMLPLALSYDHRVIDGGSAARFMVDLVGAIEGFGEDGVRT